MESADHRRQVLEDLLERVQRNRALLASQRGALADQAAPSGPAEAAAAPNVWEMGAADAVEPAPAPEPSPAPVVSLPTPQPTPAIVSEPSPAPSAVAAAPAVEQHVLPESQVVEMLGLGDQGEAAPAAVEPVMPAAAEPTAPAATAPAAAAPAPAQAVADDDPIVEVYEGDAAANAMADGAMPSLGQATAGGDASLPVSGADEALMAPIADDSLPVAVHEAPEEVPGPTSDVGAAVPALHPHEAAPTDAYADTEVATHPPAAAAAPATAPAAEPMPTPAVVAAPVSSAAQPAAFEPEPSSLSAEVAAPRRGKGLWWAVGILLAAAAIGGGAYVAMNWPLP